MPTRGTGKASVDGKSITFKSAIAVWNPASQELIISLFPFKLEKKHLEALDRVPADYVVADYDEKKPFMRIDLEFKPGASKKFKASDVEFHAVTLWRVRGENENISGQRTDELIGDVSIKGFYHLARPIQLKAKGKYQFIDGRTMTWNVSTHCRVYKQKS